MGVSCSLYLGTGSSRSRKAPNSHPELKPFDGCRKLLSAWGLGTAGIRRRAGVVRLRKKRPSPLRKGHQEDHRCRSQVKAVVRAASWLKLGKYRSRAPCPCDGDAVLKVAKKHPRQRSGRKNQEVRAIGR
jgi:hypothetical protein